MKRLAERPRDFSFMQAARLLIQSHLAGGAKNACFLRMRADLSLGFPESDLTAIESAGPDGVYRKGGDIERAELVRLTASFFGLYGSASPLPTFYTEELLDERGDDESVQRDFLDIPGQTLYSVYLEGRFRYRLMDKIVSFGLNPDLDRLFCLTGLGHPELRDHFDLPGNLIRSSGLLAQLPRSAAGLRCFLRDQLQAEVEVEQCVRDRPGIPEDQRCLLGEANSSLGQDCRLGECVDDCLGRIRLTIGGLTTERFRELCPGERGHAEFMRLVNFFCRDPLDVDLALAVRPGAASAVRLGEPAGASLGVGAWLGHGPLEKAEAFFSAQESQDEIEPSRKRS